MDILDAAAHKVCSLTFSSSTDIKNYIQDIDATTQSYFVGGRGLRRAANFAMKWK
jgi:hypothetical protein